MAPEEIVEAIRKLQLEHQKLNERIEGLETAPQSAEQCFEMKMALTQLRIAKEEQTFLLLEQQGDFTSPISCSFPICCHLISMSPITNQCWKISKVRGMNILGMWDLICDAPVLWVPIIFHQTGGELKTIYLCLPSERIPKILKHRWNSTDAMIECVARHGGGDLYHDVDNVTGVIDCVQSFDDLVDGSVYYLVNSFYDTVVNNRTRAQVESRVLEEQLSMALVEHLGGIAHVHRNLKFMDEHSKDTIEFDRIVIHEGADDVPDSVVNVLEFALSPQVEDVKLLLDKVEMFKLHAPFSSHFRSVGTVVPVLGGKMWSDEVIQKCQATNAARVLQGMRPILRMQPSGKGFKVIREFSTFRRAFLKHL